MLNCGIPALAVTMVSAHFREGDEVQRSTVAGAHDVEENGFVARLGGTAVDAVVTRVDDVDEGAPAQ